MATVPARPQVSVEEYERTPALFGRCEYVDGKVIEKPLPTRKHSLLQGWLSFLFYKYYFSLVHGPELHSKLQQSKWRLPDFSVQTPDLAKTEKYALAPLLLVIEIRSPEDRLSEILAKFEEYQQWGVPFCWLLDPETERAWTYHREGDFDEIKVDGNIEAGEIRLSVAEIFSIFHR